MFSLLIIISLGIVIAGSLRKGINNRIIGGHLVDIEDYPFQVSIQYYKRHICGGSIISEKYILTAAHCIRDYWEDEYEAYQIRYGSTYRTYGGKLADIKRIIPHHKYKTFDYDIAIVELKKYLVFDAKCQPVILAEANHVIVDGTVLHVSGYGVASETDDVGTAILRAVHVPTVNHAVCEKIYYFLDEIRITPRMICAGYMRGGKDSCSGDSGGPLVDKDTQVGIVSFGEGCASARYPGVYTNIASLRYWIRKNTGV